MSELGFVWLGSEVEGTVGDDDPSRARHRACKMCAPADLLDEVGELLRIALLTSRFAHGFVVLSLVCISLSLSLSLVSRTRPPLSES